MKYLISGLMMLASGQVMADIKTEQNYPACDLETQRNVSETGTRITDPLEAHISLRIDILQADISTARKARILTQAQADKLWQSASRVRNETAHFVKQQGFLSAAERASYDRELDDIAIKFCGKIEG
ncbi:hypothetical protein IBT49_27205 [Erwinia sp. S63]|uniref:hypothetical protein n=1 Tax=Erwiniaceae TaxID=1903409 RepID=UPI00190A8FE6|nr:MULTISPECIES: hypothetical protein [Erwiniaceae]MBK0004763.1 hypothetical protein [Erwinia sp. S38]MBK0094004.1 hypothetical protein [Erwinia sp. S59]MBK0099684.1 hypothetical protein [Erwinia sp. S63]MBK0127869.1 hypothetical protein [Pantoea sp. S61]